MKAVPNTESELYLTDDGWMEKRKGVLKVVSEQRAENLLRKGIKPTLMPRGIGYGNFAR